MKVFIKCFMKVFRNNCLIFIHISIVSLDTIKIPWFKWKFIDFLWQLWMIFIKNLPVWQTNNLCFCKWCEPVLNIMFCTKHDAVFPNTTQLDSRSVICSSHHQISSDHVSAHSYKFYRSRSTAYTRHVHQRFSTFFW